MKRFQKALFALTAVVLLGWMGASTASAQTQFLASPSQARPVRSEGLTEAVGSVVLSAQSTGVIVATSTISFNFGAAIEATSGSVTNSFAGGVACAGLPPGPLTPVANPANVTVNGNVLTITFSAACGVDNGESISVTGVRVNAGAIGAGNNVTVSISSQVPPASAATNPVSIIQFVALTVATVQAAPSTAVSGGSKILLLCDSASTLLTGQAVTLTVTENFNQAFLSLFDETGLNNNGNVVAMGITFSLVGIPVGVKLDVTLGASTASLATVLVNGGATATFTSKAGQQDVDITATVDTDGSGTNTTGDPEKLVLVFTFTVPDKALLQTTEGTATAKISLTGGSAGSTAVPRFGANTQSSRDALKLIACASYLIFPWVAYTADGNLDTGIAISNTSADPAIIGTRGQTGDVTLYFWTADGSTAPAPLKIATALAAGKSATFVASQIGKAYTGYVIAVCGFQMGHGLAAFLSPKVGVFGASYLALNATNPRTVVAGAEALGQ